MKRILGLLLVGVLLVGCGEKEEVKIPEVPETEVVQNEEVQEEEVQEEEEPEVSVGESTNEEAIEVTPIDIEMEGVRIKIREIVRGVHEKYALRVELENTNDFDMSLWVTELGVNKNFANVSNFTDIPGGGSIEHKIDLFDSNMFTEEYEEIQEVLVKFDVGTEFYVPGTTSERMILRPLDFEGEVAVPEATGSIVFVDGPVEVYVEELWDSSMDLTGLKVYMVNGLEGQDIDLRLHNTMVNGDYVDTEHRYGIIPPGYHILRHENFNEFEMQKRGFDRFESIAVVVSVFNADTGEHYYDHTPYNIYN